MILTRSYTAPVGSTQRDEKMVTSKGTFQEAVDNCAGWGEEWSLMGPRSVDEERNVYKQITSKMKESQINSVWTTVRHHGTRKWQNVDDTYYGGEIQLADKQGNMCSLLKLRYEAVKAETCNSQGEGYICQKKDCAHCPYDISPRNCFKVEHMCYVFGCDAGGWYDAQNACSRQGFQIISLQSNSRLRQIVTWLNKRQHNACDNFWVGLRKEAWYYNDSKAFHEVGSTFWYTGEPEPGSECVVLQRFKEGYYWKSVSCLEKHPYICAQEEIRYLTNTTEANTFLLKNKDHKNASLYQRKPILKDQTATISYPSGNLPSFQISMLSVSVAVLIMVILCVLILLTIRCDLPLQPFLYIKDWIKKVSNKRPVTTEASHPLVDRRDDSDKPSE